MSVTNAAGQTLTKAALQALTTTDPAPDAVVTVTEDILQRYSYGGGSGFEQGTRLLYAAGQKVLQSDLDALFETATVATVSPATGPAAGGTDVVITGTNLGGVVGVTFGGTAATLVRAVSESKITCKAPAHAAGAVAVVVADDSGNINKSNAYTYA